NTPIERLWVELGRRFCRAWRVFFLRLSRLHHLEKENPVHRWLLDYLFLDMINEDCRRFVEEWNAHPMRNRGNKCLSPDEILQFYQYQKESTGSGDEAQSDNEEPENDVTNEADANSDYNPSDEEDTWMDSNEDHDHHTSTTDNNTEIQDSDDEAGYDVNPADDVDPNIHHEAVDVPRGNCPFDNAALAVFKTCIERVYQEGEIPRGYNILAEEWEDGYYSETEQLAIGRSQKIKTVHLPNHIWLARARLWVQALCLLQT
ncbi:hypothetical protein BJ165DRAFT_1314359, partial [Panaeolus papilionaceus]